MVGFGGGQEKVSVYSKAEGFLVLFFTLVWVSFYVGCVLYMYIIHQLLSLCVGIYVFTI